MTELTAPPRLPGPSHGQTPPAGGGGEAWYTGDFWDDESPAVDMDGQRALVGPVVIGRATSPARSFFRRTRRHIRDEATDLSALWFVRRGRLVYSDQCGSQSAQPGDLMLTGSVSPFLMEFQPEDGGDHDVLHITLPTHLLRDFLHRDVGNVLLLPGDRREILIAEHMVGGILRDGDGLATQSARTLVEAALAIVGYAMQAREAGMPGRQSVADRRLAEVLRFIEMHLSDPGLSTGIVANGCGISPRYLSFLLRMTGTSFSELVWKQRLQKARAWLAASNPRDVLICEIAYGVGFKSPAHFSRMFKRAFNMSPRQYRVRPNADTVAVSETGVRLQ